MFSVFFNCDGPSLSSAQLVGYTILINRRICTKELACCSLEQVAFAIIGSDEIPHKVNLIFCIMNILATAICYSCQFCFVWIICRVVCKITAVVGLPVNLVCTIGELFCCRLCLKVGNIVCGLACCYIAGCICAHLCAVQCPVRKFVTVICYSIKCYQFTAVYIALCLLATCTD